MIVSEYRDDHGIGDVNAESSLPNGAAASSTASTTSAPASSFGGSTASNTGPVPASSFGGSTEHSRQGTTPTIGKLSPSRYFFIKEEGSNECLVCEKVFDRILLNGVCEDEDCWYKYNMDTCYECGTEILTSDEYKNQGRDEDVCKACWDGTTNEDEVADDEEVASQ